MCVWKYIRRCYAAGRSVGPSVRRRRGGVRRRDHAAVGVGVGRGRPVVHHRVHHLLRQQPPAEGPPVARRRPHHLHLARLHQPCTRSPDPSSMTQPTHQHERNCNSRGRQAAASALNYLARRRARGGLPPGGEREASAWPWRREEGNSDWGVVGSRRTKGVGWDPWALNEAFGGFETAWSGFCTAGRRSAGYLYGKDDVEISDS